MKLQICDNTGLILSDGVTVDALTTDVEVSGPTGVKTYRIMRSVALASNTAAGSSVRVYCEPGAPPPPHP